MNFIYSAISRKASQLRAVH